MRRSVLLSATKTTSTVSYHMSFTWALEVCKEAFGTWQIVYYPHLLLK